MTDYDDWMLAIAAVSAATDIVMFAALMWQLRILRMQVSESHESIVLDHDRRR